MSTAVPSPYNSTPNGAQDQAAINAALAGWNVTTQDQSLVAAQRFHKYRPNRAKQIASWISVGFGALMVFGGLSQVMSDGGQPMDWTMGTFGAALFALPGAYWLHRNSSDRELIANWIAARRTRQELSMVLHGDEAELLGAAEPLPLLPKRRWGLVIVMEFVLLILASFPAH